MKLPFQYDRPLFVRIPFKTRNKEWEKGQHLPWKEMNLDADRIQILFSQGYLVHNEEFEVVMQVGDGLELLDVAGLHDIVNDYNERLSKVTTIQKVLQVRKCPKSKLADRQRGLLRSWRRNNLDWLEKAEQNK